MTDQETHNSAQYERIGRVTILDGVVTSLARVCPMLVVIAQGLCNYRPVTDK
jgi:hypothetical protein